MVSPINGKYVLYSSLNVFRGQWFNCPYWHWPKYMPAWK